MAKHRFEEIFGIVLENSFPGMGWRYRGKTYDTADATSSRGLLHVFMRQGLMTATVTSDSMELDRHVRYMYDDESLTGVRVDIDDDIPCTPLIFFCLDAAHYAQVLAPGEDAGGRPVVDIEVIESPIPPTADHFFRPVWSVLPERHQELVDRACERSKPSDGSISQQPGTQPRMEDDLHELMFGQGPGY